MRLWKSYYNLKTFESFFYRNFFYSSSSNKGCKLKNLTVISLGRVRLSEKLYQLFLLGKSRSAKKTNFKIAFTNVVVESFLELYNFGRALGRARFFLDERHFLDQFLVKLF